MQRQVAFVERGSRRRARPVRAPAEGRARHAVVIGGSAAGLCCAEILSRNFESVTVLERDPLPAASSPRRGVPQAPHQHLLLARGQRVLEELFPGLRAEITAAGTAPMDVAGELAWLTPAGWAPRFRSGITILPCSRQLLEACLRRRVRDNTCVEIREEQEAVGLVGGRGGAVVGVRARSAGRRDLAGDEIAADLVVDASGRGTRLPRWLEEMGHRLPAQCVVDAHVSYTSRLYEGAAALPDRWRGAFIQAAPPASLRGGTLLPIEGGRTLVTLIGRGDDVPPIEEEGFTAFARSLRSPMLHEAVAGLAPLMRPVSSRSTENRRHRYERMSSWPDGLVAVGDAVCAFNPVYGQGMTTAAMAAAALGDMVDRRAGAGVGVGVAAARRYQRRLARVHAGPWMLDTDLDLRVHGVSGPTPGRRVHIRQAYMAHVGRLAAERPAARLALLEVLHMLRAPSSLLRPAIALAVAAQATRDRAGRAPTASAVAGPDGPDSGPAA